MFVFSVDSLPKRPVFHPASSCQPSWWRKTASAFYEEAFCFSSYEPFHFSKRITIKIRRTFNMNSFFSCFPHISSSTSSYNKEPPHSFLAWLLRLWQKICFFYATGVTRVTKEAERKVLFLLCLRSILLVAPPSPLGFSFTRYLKGKQYKSDAHSVLFIARSGYGELNGKFPWWSFNAFVTLISLFYDGWWMWMSTGCGWDLLLVSANFHKYRVSLIR